MGKREDVQTRENVYSYIPARLDNLLGNALELSDVD